ncbi:MAG: ROK family protein [Bryobacteraceae bacterium]
MESARLALAVDLGGTKLSTAVIDENGAIHAARKAPVSKNGVAGAIEQIADEAAQVVKASGRSWDGICGAAVIVPGVFRKADGMVWAPNLWGDSGVPFLAGLQAHLPVPVLIDSDRAGYVQGERWLGIARGLRDVVFLSVGTGIGAGIVSGGRLIRGAGGVAGAVGWFALNPQFEPIYAELGCWEAEAAGPAVARHAQDSSAERVADAARRGDSTALRAVQNAAGYLSMGIANLISALNPQMVVLGGGFMQASDLLLEPIRQGVKRWAQPHAAAQARIEMTQLGEQAGLFGAAKLALFPAEDRD